MTDRELLSEYARSGSSAAFAEIVRRHSAMVHSACLRVLGDGHAAEDAAQAAFLVLMDKARRLPADTVLSGWLFLTAQHAALNERKRSMRRERHERKAAVARERTEAPPGAGWGEVRPELDAAIAALPSRQRDALVLYYLGGRSEEQVAREMGCARGTVAAHLSAALGRLRTRLAARGVGLSGAALAGLLSTNAVTAAPAGLAESIIAVCSGQAAASAGALSIAQGTVRTLAWAKAKALATVFCVAAAATGGGAVAVGYLRPVDRSMEDDPAIIARLAALGEGGSARLPEFRVLGVEREPEDRSLRRAYRYGPGYRHRCNAMPWAPDRRSALYAGSNHKSFHVNDVWEFALGANAWRRIVPSDGENHFAPALWAAGARYGKDVDNNLRRWREWMTANLEVAGGSLRTSGNGGPYSPIMTWDQLAYDSDRGRLYWMLSGGSSHGAVKDYARATGQDPEELAGRIEPGTTLWWFDLGTGRWSRQIGEMPRPRTTGMAGTLRYIPEARRLVWYISAQNTIPYEYDMWTYDAESNTWQDLAPNGGVGLKAMCLAGMAPGNGIQSAYSPDHGLLVAVGGDSTWSYDFAANCWERTAAGETGNAGIDMDTVFTYDRAAGVFLLAQPLSGGRLRAYDPVARSWSDAPISGPPMPATKCAGFYDERLDALVLYDGTGSVWVYRHRRAAR